jgi:hypothetical protein
MPPFTIPTELSSLSINNAPQPLVSPYIPKHLFYATTLDSTTNPQKLAGKKKSNQHLFFIFFSGLRDYGWVILISAGKGSLFGIILHTLWTDDIHHLPTFWVPFLAVLDRYHQLLLWFPVNAIDRCGVYSGFRLFSSFSNMDLEFGL